MASLKEIIDYSKANPNTDYARQAMDNLKSGKWDDKAKAEGLDLTPIGRANYSTSTPTTTPAEDPNKHSLKNRLTEAFGDFKETAVNVKNTVVDTAKDIKSTVTNPNFSLPEKGLGVISKLVGGVSDAIGEEAMGIGKLLISQDQETKLKELTQKAMQPIAESEIVGDLKKWYDGLDEHDKLKVDSAGTFAMLVADVLTLKGASTAVDVMKPMIQKGTDLAVQAEKQALQTVKDASGAIVDKVTPDTGKMAETIIDSVNRINPSKRVEFQQMTGKGEGEWLKERGIIGTRDETITQLVTNYQAMRKNVDEALEKMPGTYRDDRVTVVAKESAEMAKGMESPEATRMQELATKAEGVGLDTKEINEVKRYYERNVKLGYMKDATKTSEQVQRATNRDSAIREFLLETADKNGFGNLREINKEIQASRFLADEIAGKLEGQGGNNLMGLTDMIMLTPALLNPKAVAGIIGKKMFSSETFKSAMAKTLAGFPERKPVPSADMAEIEKRASELLKRQEDLRIETEKSAILADELLKAGYTMQDGPQGFITKNNLAEIIDMPLTKQEQAMIRAGESREKHEQVVQFIIEQREQGNVVGEGFVMMPADPKYLQLPERAGAMVTPEPKK